MSVPSDRDTAGVAPRAIDLRRLPWVRPLVRAYARDFGSVAPLFAGDPAQPDAWREAIARAQAATHDRAAIAAVLAHQLERRGAAAEARDNAASLAMPATVAVVTGQQAGLFGGPLYTLLKAATAIRLAREVSARHHVRAVPIFWVAGEDHDWNEVRTATVLDADFNVRDIAVADPPGAGVKPVADLPLGSGISGALGSLEAALAQTEFRADVLAQLRSHYREGRSLSDAFAGWIDALCSRHGLVVFEGHDPAAKPLVADLFEGEIASPDRTCEAVNRGAAAMRRLGHDPQVESTTDGVALFYVDGNGRHPIRRHGDGFAVNGQPRSAEELRTAARRHPERFSPNVILRPLVQDRLFPTICYVGGPAELAYQAELGEVYAAFGVTRPLLYSRAMATILDPAAARFLERSEIPLESLQAQDEAVLNQLLAAQLPPALDRELSALAGDVSDRVERLKGVVASVDPTLAGTVDTTRDRLLETLKTLQTKVIQASKRKDETLRRQFLRTRALVFPNGQPQERALNVSFFINRYGPGLVDRLLEVLPPDTGEHYLITV